MGCSCGDQPVALGPPGLRREIWQVTAQADRRESIARAWQGWPEACTLGLSPMRPSPSTSDCARGRRIQEGGLGSRPASGPGCGACWPTGQLFAGAAAGHGDGHVAMFGGTWRGTDPMRRLLAERSTFRGRSGGKRDGYVAVVCTRRGDESLRREIGLRDGFVVCAFGDVDGATKRWPC